MNKWQKRFIKPKENLPKVSCTHTWINLNKTQLGDEIEHYDKCTLCGQYTTWKQTIEKEVEEAIQALPQEPKMCDECLELLINKIKDIF